MKKQRLIFCAVLSISLLFTITASAGDWYVVKHDLGDTVVIDYKPGPRWTVVSGPYDTKQEAAKAGKIDIPVGMAEAPTERKDPVKKLSKGETKGGWYVVKHDLGDTVVTSYKPGPRWTVISGPHATKEEAARAGKIDIPVGMADAPTDRKDPVEKLSKGDAEGDWYVVKHDLGDTSIIKGKPGPRWTVVSGPYKSKGAAARAGKIDIPEEPAVNPADRSPN